MKIVILSFILSALMATRSWFLFWWLTLFYIMHIFLMDYKTYYIPYLWIGLGCGLWILWPSFYILPVVLFGFPCFFLWLMCPDKIGSADVFYICLFGSLLGLPRFIVCMLIATGCGFLYYMLHPKSMIPFVSCLCVGFVISFWRGFLLYDILTLWK